MITVCLCILPRCRRGRGHANLSKGGEMTSCTAATSDTASAVCKLHYGFPQTTAARCFPVICLCTDVDEPCSRIPSHWLCCMGRNFWDTNIFWLAQLFLRWMSGQSSTIDVHIAFLPVKLHQFIKQHELSRQKFFSFFFVLFFASRLRPHRRLCWRGDAGWGGVLT